MGHYICDHVNFRIVETHRWYWLLLSLTFPCQIKLLDQPKHWLLFMRIDQVNMLSNGKHCTCFVAKTVFSRLVTGMASANAATCNEKEKQQQQKRHWNPTDITRTPCYRVTSGHGEKQKQKQLLARSPPIQHTHRQHASFKVVDHSASLSQNIKIHWPSFAASKFARNWWSAPISFCARVRFLWKTWSRKQVQNTMSCSDDQKGRWTSLLWRCHHIDWGCS